MNFRDKILTVLESEADARAIEFEGRWFSRSEIGILHRQLEARLSTWGLGAGARVGLVARNRPAHVAAFASLLATQRCAVMIYSSQTPEAIAGDIRRLRLAAVIADAQDWTQETLAVSKESGMGAISLGQGGSALSARPLLSDIGAAQRELISDAAMELLSSGTTGPPKRIPLSAFTFEQTAIDAAATYASGASSAVIPPNVVFHPLGNVAGVNFLIPFLIDGRPFALLERFRLDSWLEAVRRHRPARASLPPAVLRTLLDEHVTQADLSSFVTIGVGAAALDPELQDEFERRYKIPLLAGYGATEFGGVVANWTLDLRRQYSGAKKGTVGKARPGVSLRIIDPDDQRELGVDSIGLLEVRATRVGNDWIRTSDLASMDADGFLRLHGRADGAINRGGFKVLPDEVARVLRGHEKVADAVVIGIDDSRLGQVPAAVVEARDPADPPTPAELETLVRRSLLAYQVPVAFMVVDVLPRNVSLKVDLPAVRRLFAGSAPP